MAIILTVYPNSLEVTQGEHIVAGTVNATEVQFQFPPGDNTWEGMTLVACFRSLLCERSVILDFGDAACKFPWEVNAEGSEGGPVSIGLYGAGDPEGKNIIRSAGWVDLPFSISPGAFDAADPSAEYTPTQYEQLLIEVSDVVRRMDGLAKVETSVEEVKTAAEQAARDAAFAGTAAKNAEESAEKAKEFATQLEGNVAIPPVEGVPLGYVPTRTDNGVEWKPASKEIELDTTLEREGMAADSKAVGDRLKKAEDHIADLLYEPIAIDSFGHNAGTRELGEVVEAVVLSWTTSKAPAALELDGEAIDADLTSKSLEGLSLTETTSWTLKAADERGAVAEKSATLSFLNGVYYGAGAAPEAVDSAFTLGLTKTLTSTRKRTVTVDAGEGEYIWYALPVRLGECTFKVGGFEGGFDLVNTIDFTNSQGYTEPYYIYRSGQTGLGSTTVEVS